MMPSWSFLAGVMSSNTSRREILVGALAALPAAGMAGAAPIAAPAPVRRLVTGEGADGRSGVLYATAGANTVELNGATITRLWETTGVPAELPLTTDRGAVAGNAYREGFNGTSLYVADIPPGNSTAIPMHREDSVDYIAVLAGEIDLVLETGRTTMRTGDVLVQGGNLHTWENRGEGFCRLLVVVLRARRDA
jgi:hypothetical protein